MKATMQRKCGCGEKSAPCRCNEAPQLQRFSPSGGRPLDSSVRTRFESSFGFDFSSVRIHTDDAAAKYARAVDADAYTIGHDIVFSEARYAPRTQAGEKLLAHELTHVVQQRGHPRLAGTLEISHPADPAEQEADRVATSLDHGGASKPISEAVHGIARQPKQPVKSAQEELLGPPPTLSPKLKASIDATMAEIEASKKLWVSIYQQIDLPDKQRPEIVAELVRLLPNQLALWRGEDPLVAQKSGSIVAGLNTVMGAAGDVMIDSMLARAVTLLIAPALAPEILIALIVGAGVALAKKAFESSPSLAECQRVVLDNRYVEFVFSLDRAIVKVLGKGAPAKKDKIIPLVPSSTYVAPPLGGTLPKAFGK